MTKEGPFFSISTRFQTHFRIISLWACIYEGTFGKYPFNLKMHSISKKRHLKHIKVFFLHIIGKTLCAQKSQKNFPSFSLQREYFTHFVFLGRYVYTILDATRSPTFFFLFFLAN